VHRRRKLIIALGAGALTAPLGSFAQQQGKVWRIGFLAGGVRPPDGATPAPLRERLQALGYAEGKDVTYEGRWSEGRNERLPELAAELIARKVDLMVALGGPAAVAAKQASATIPVVVVGAGDLVETGLVASLARPGGNVTGVNDPAAVLSAKRLEFLKEVVPTAKRVAVLWNAGDYAMTLRYREIEKAAQALGISIEPLGVREPDDFDVALAGMTRARPDALMMVTDTLTNLNRKRVLDYAAIHQIPAMYEFGFLVQSGGLISYGTGQGEGFKLAADYVAKVLRGAKSGELPVEQLNRYFLVVNLKTAKALGLTVPQSLLLRADEVIE
jgi:putative ABC transport system substrate-binding protein